mgnify:CR=1 FL=1|tara:strand:+ start:306 stop:524 length:219 start_codon:yes stop_codon:yes gene_type:complete
MICLVLDLIVGIILIGNVDRINEGFATIEYIKNKRTIYIDIDLKNSLCQPEEGELVFFTKEKIISCSTKPKK